MSVFVLQDLNSIDRHFSKRIWNLLQIWLHCLYFRGDDFRPTYKSLNQLRACVSANVSFMCLTGTVTNDARLKIIDLLQFNKSVTISIPLRRLNIHVSLREVKTNDFTFFNYIIKSLITNSCPKTVIYCRNIKSVAAIYELFSSTLGILQFKDRKKSLKNRNIAMFHRSTAPRNKEHILSDFPKIDCALKVVIATSAFGMGVDIPDIEQVIFYGVPRNMETYAQQLGRSGRNGSQAFSVILKLPMRFACNEEMKKFVKSNVCRRKQVEDHFNQDLVASDFSFDGSENSALVCVCHCCDLCSLSCTCEHPLSTPWMQKDGNDEGIDTIFHDDDDDALDDLIMLYMADLVKQLRSEGMNIPSTLIESIVQNRDVLFSVEDIVTEFSVSDDIGQLIYDVLLEANAV